jgi:hypothetical protein
MATCASCRREINDPETRGCSQNTYTFVVGELANEDGQTETLTSEYPRRTVPVIANSDGESYRCTGCNALEGNYHHPGCEKELCPRCGRDYLNECQCEEIDGKETRFDNITPLINSSYDREGR